MADLIDERELKQLQRKLISITDGFDKPQLRKISRKGAPPARKAMKALTPVRSEGKELNRYYSKGKGKNKDGPFAFIARGNLKRSVRLFPVKRMRRSAAAWVGPVKIGRFTKGETVGRKASTASGYYAQMLFGSWNAWINRVIKPAIKRSEKEAIGRMAAFAKTVLDKQIRKLKFKL